MKLRTFQREDIARAALHDGAIFGLDPGLGKTVCGYLYSLLKVGLLHKDGKPVVPIRPAQPVLFVAQGDLHDQIIAEGVRHFKIRPVVIDTTQTFLRLSTLTPAGRRTLPPGFYLTTYTALTRNGVQPFPELDSADPEAAMRRFHLSQSDLQEFFAGRAERLRSHYRQLGVTPDSTAAEVKAAWFTLRKRMHERLWPELDEAYHLLAAYAPQRPPAGDVTLADLSPEQRRNLARHFVKLAHAAFSHNIGESRYRSDMGASVRCVYSPCLADYCHDTFAVVVPDEGTKLKGDDTIIGTGTRWMNPRYRLPMTGTPIKNRLPDIFWLAHFATGGHHDAHPRFPFGVDDREEFNRQFSVSERNLTREKLEKRRFVKLTPQVCNIHNLWKLLAPIVIRRRRDDCGEEIVKMNRHVIRVPMGSLQASVYKFYLDAKFKDVKGKPAIGAQLQALRIAAANPASELLHRPDSDNNQTIWRPPYNPYPHRITNQPPRGVAYTPKLACALNVIREILERREQFIAFSAFHDSLDSLSARLHEAGVRHSVLDGRVSPRRRGEAAARFKRGPASGIPGMLAGIEAMSEGHSFSLCRNVILMCYSWALDKMLQAIARVWRLDSPFDVNLYAIICDGTVERKLEANIHEKRDAAELVLDGHLLGEDPVEQSLFELLQIAEKEFMGAEGTIDERELEKHWPALRGDLSDAQRLWGTLPLLGERAGVRASPNPLLTRVPANVIPLRPAIVRAPALPPAETPFKNLPLWRQTFRARHTC